MFSSFPPKGFLIPIFENAEIPFISPDSLDAKFVVGWRHFGTRFFRCNFAIHDGAICGVLPLRIPVGDFAISKSQRRVLRRNADLDVRIVRAIITQECHDLFERHKQRFAENIPESLFDFLDPKPAKIPCETRAVEVRCNGRLIAISFIDIGTSSLSSIYGMFDPDFANRSLGIFTILSELAYAAEIGKRHYYLGYSYTVSSPYDYKMHFAPLEAYDWNEGWRPYPHDFRWSRDLDDPHRAL